MSQDAVLGITKEQLDAQFTELSKSVPPGPLRDEMRRQFDEGMARVPDGVTLPFVRGGGGTGHANSGGGVSGIGPYGPTASAVPAPEAPEPTPQDDATVPAPDVLAEARTLIYGDREDQYGDPRDAFARIAGLWSAYLGIEVTSADFANLMILMKTARTKDGYHRDSYVDIVGYAANAERIAG
ncbi:DUF6378 domain-containing protein [Nocardia testacea]|uniref:DUF6378 domain-containing protein n=1 Tax=Nocardia testacea TaxID=248551 RepID=UPI0002EDDB77|nr:DUF6378 domain-containing protein [Nocardia testacea]